MVVPQATTEKWAVETLITAYSAIGGELDKIIIASLVLMLVDLQLQVAVATGLTCWRRSSIILIQFVVRRTCSL